jgi:hypothetical protein
MRVTRARGWNFWAILLGDRTQITHRIDSISFLKKLLVGYAAFSMFCCGGDGWRL